MFARDRLVAGMLALAVATGAHAQEASTNAPQTAATPSGISPLHLLGDEARRYFDDSIALMKAPASWSSSDRWTFAAAVAGIGTVMVFDERLAQETAERRSASTDRLSRATTRFGAADAFYISGSLVLSGIVFHEDNVTSMGREAIEASVFTGIIGGLSKTAFGRERPVAAADETVFRPGSSNQSFPSGHTTEAFTLASVVAARSSGWVIPTLAYTGACLVAFDRVNDRAHFPSDVVAGAVLGVAVGRFVVHRHQPSLPETGFSSVEIVPIRNGAGIRVEF